MLGSRKNIFSSFNFKAELWVPTAWFLRPCGWNCKRRWENCGVFWCWVTRQEHGFWSLKRASHSPPL
jgi:hypothetical protein